ncbi:MAG: Crp/Fnr family transcriptional regulator [Deltaproteobacteria bacterium]|nr:Crp/Fnr family transcriptional regulator [Deltaproteobacteria bacterium]
MSLIERFGRTAAAGTVLFREGDAGKEMFVIQSGKVRLSRTIRGHEKTLADLPAGEFFGEMSIINDKPRAATATVVEDAQLLVLDPRTFEAMIKANTEIAVRMIKKLTGRLDVANQQIENLLLGDANSRVVHALIQMAGTGVKGDDGAVRVTADAPSLAEKTSVDDAKVEEVLARLERSRLVIAKDGALVVPDVGKLAEFLEFLEMRERFGDAGG